MARIDFDTVADDYDAARAVPLDALTAWRDALLPYLPPISAASVLDLGSGTGQFSWALAEWFPVRVLGVDPSAGMRAQAARTRSHPRVDYLGGIADALPLAGDSVGAAWLSTVIHHFPDLPAAAAELARVLQPAAPLLIRSAFPGRTADITVLRFFPQARAVVEGTYPTLIETEAAFAAHGFRRVELRALPQRSAADLHAAVARVRVRSDTTLRAISDADFAAGLQRLQEAAQTQPPAPVIDVMDLLVLRRD
jgi:ubiquinone/menaquinone biosynthesis C-methylase UbiE